MSQFSENENWYVCSIVVQARPEKLNQVKEAILAIPTAEIHGENLMKANWWSPLKVTVN